MRENIETMVLQIFNIFMFILAIGLIIFFVMSFDRNKDAAIKHSQQNEAVSTAVADVEDPNKGKILGSTVIMEILELPDEVEVRVNATVLNAKMANTGEDYVTYAKKYGTDLLEGEIHARSYYTKTVELDSSGNLVRVTYTLV